MNLVCVGGHNSTHNSLYYKKSQINNLNFYLKKLEKEKKKEGNNIIRAEVN